MKLIIKVVKEEDTMSKISECSECWRSPVIESTVPEIPDDIFRYILKIKHDNFVRNFAKEDLRKRILRAARIEKERKQREERMAICEMRFGCAILVAALVVIFVFYFVVE
jgi:hypothetical protein